jgi:hypothetical protein
LSSAQDALEYKIYVKSRREDFAELRIVRPFVNSLIALKILPTPNGGKYTVKWSDLFAVSEADRVKIGLDRSSALKNYTSSPTAEAVMSPEDFLKYGLGLQPDDITSVKDGMNTGILEEARAQKAIQPFTQPAAQPKQPIVKPKQPITRAAK